MTVVVCNTRPRALGHPLGSEAPCVFALHITPFRTVGPTLAWSSTSQARGTTGPPRLGCALGGSAPMCHSSLPFSLEH